MIFTCHIQTPPPTLAPIPESDGAPILKKLPPPTLPKPLVKKPSKAAPLPPPKPKKPEALVPEDSFQVSCLFIRNYQKIENNVCSISSKSRLQDETMDGSEV